MDGFLCNRKEFHGKQLSATSCIWWKNINDKETEELVLTPYDLNGNSVIRATADIKIKKARHNLSELYDKRVFEDDTEDGIICERNGKEFEKNGRKIYVKPIYNKNIIGYLVSSNFQIDRKDVMLTRCGIYKAHGFFLRDDNFIEKLPLFVAGVFPYNKWYKTDIYSKSNDLHGEYLKDIDFLKKSLIYTALTNKNKCLSFMGSDSRFYRNELCFDNEDTLAYVKLQNFIKDGLTLNEQEQTLMKYWNDVLFEAKKTDEYKTEVSKNPDVRYGLWQISEELNVPKNTGRFNKKGEPIFVKKYPALNTEINKLNDALKNYYDNELKPLLFKYELLK